MVRCGALELVDSLSDSPLAFLSHSSDEVTHFTSRPRSHMSTDIERIVQALSVIHVNVDRQNAENYLKYAEENTSQYYSILQTIYLQNNLDNTVRTLAAIGFKNGIDKCWRRTAKR